MTEMWSERIKEGVTSALLLDVENMVFGLRDAGYPQPRDAALELTYKVILELRKHKSPPLIGRAYGDWTIQALDAAAKRLRTLGIEPQFVFTVRGRNSADIKLAIEAVDTVHTRPEVGLFIIAGGDRDYMPLVAFLRERGKDLLLVAPRSSVSDDLLNLVGEESFIDAGEVLGPPAPKEVVPVANGLKSAAVADRPLEERCLLLFLELQRRYRNKELWLAPMLRDELPDAFPDLSHGERRDLVNRLQELGWIRTDKRPDPLRQREFTIVVVEEGHPEVKLLAKESAEPTANSV